MSQQTNFPIAGATFVNPDGTLTKQGSTLLRSLWLASAGAPQQTGWAKSTATENQGPLANYTGGTNTTDLAAQVALLTEVVGALINALASYGILQD
jgi:hypothetical protein